MGLIVSELTKERLLQVLSIDPETGVIRWAARNSNRVKVGDLAGTVGPEGYLMVRIDGRRYFAHRIVWLWVHGEWPRALIDHVNCQRLDNRIANLREADRIGNGQNRRNPPANKKSCQLLGATFDKRRCRWAARITVNSRRKHIGYYASAEEAHAAYVAEKVAKHPFQTIVGAPE